MSARRPEHHSFLSLRHAVGLVLLRGPPQADVAQGLGFLAWVWLFHRPSTLEPIMRNTFAIANAIAVSPVHPFVAVDMLNWGDDTLAARVGVPRNFHDSCQAELALSEDEAQSSEWLDRMLSRRVVTSVVVVGSLAGLFALAV
jgi:hypothetical protein